MQNEGESLGMRKLRVAVIGLGKMGLLHSSILCTIPSVELVALCDKSYVLRRLAKKLFKTTAVVNDTAKLSDLSIDCAYVTAPIPAHYPIVKTLFSQSITRNIFVEKTLASSWNRANELCELTKKTPGINMVGYMKRFSMTFSKARQFLVDNTLGELVSFDAFAYSSDFADCKQMSKALSRGGVLSDLGSHVIDLSLWFFGDFDVESATLKSVVDENSEDSAVFEVRKSGLVGKFNISWCENKYRLPNFGLTIQCSKGTLKVNDNNLVLEPTDGKRTILYRPDLNDNVPFLIGDPEYYRENEVFVNSVLSETQVEPSFKNASKVDYIIDQVKKSA
jgi:predicted dehydrogenase